MNFQGQEYYDDRMFVLYLVPGLVEEDSQFVRTIIYHNNPPENHVWCVVTYRNYGRYPLFRIDSFHKKVDALDYQRLIEPQTPLISLGGRIPNPILSFEEYQNWKKENNMKDYQWEKLYTGGVSSNSSKSESVMQQKSTFQGIR
jgi:hypothetical protein